MNTTRASIPTWLLLAILIAGCERTEPAAETDPESSAGRLTQEMGRATDRASEIAREQSERLINEAQERLARWREQLTDAETREDLSEDARARFDSAREKLREDLRGLENRLEELRGRGAAAWSEAAPEFRSAMDNLGESFRQFRDSFLKRETPAEPATPPPPAGPR